MQLRGTLTDIAFAKLVDEDEAKAHIEDNLPGWKVSQVESISHPLIETTTYGEDGQSFVPGAMTIDFYAYRKDTP